MSRKRTVTDRWRRVPRSRLVQGVVVESTGGALRVVARLADDVVDGVRVVGEVDLMLQQQLAPTEARVQLIVTVVGEGRGDVVVVAQNGAGAVRDGDVVSGRRRGRRGRPLAVRLVASGGGRRGGRRRD